jgi:hypothetical protein
MELHSGGRYLVEIPKYVYNKKEWAGDDPVYGYLLQEG